MAVHHESDGAVLDAGRHRLEVGRVSATHRFGQRGGCDVDVAMGQAHQRIAGRAADDARLLAVAVEQREGTRDRGRRDPC